MLTMGNIDIRFVYKYEKQFLRYSMLEYVTSCSALKFWRELLEKSLNASVLQALGAEISRNYEKIQDVATELLKIHPHEIKFMYRYGVFLCKVVNNEYEGMN